MNVSECIGDVRKRFDMKGDGMTERNKTFQVVIRTIDHEMEIEGKFCVTRSGLNEGGAEGNIVHKMTVHHIAMDSIGSCGGDSADFRTELREIAGKNRRGNERLGVIQG